MFICMFICLVRKYLIRGISLKSNELELLRLTEFGLLCGYCQEDFIKVTDSLSLTFCFWNYFPNQINKANEKQVAHWEDVAG